MISAQTGGVSPATEESSIRQRKGASSKNGILARFTRHPPSEMSRWFRTGIDGAVTIFSLRSADCDGLNFQVANARPYWPPMLPIIVAAPEAETEAATIYKLRA